MFDVPWFIESPHIERRTRIETMNRSADIPVRCKVNDQAAQSPPTLEPRFGFRISDFFRNSDLGLRILPHDFPGFICG